MQTPFNQEAGNNKTLASAGVRLVRWQVNALPDEAAIRLMLGSRHGEERQQVVRGGCTGELVHGATASVAAFAGKVRLMNGKYRRMAGEIPYERGASCQFRHSQQNVRSGFAFAATYSELP